MDVWEASSRCFDTKSNQRDCKFLCRSEAKAVRDSTTGVLSPPTTTKKATHTQKKQNIQTRM